MNAPISFGLPDSELALIRAACREFPEIAEVIVFGSRAMGNFKPGSDVDLAVKGPVDSTIAQRFSARLNEHLPLPYRFDVVGYATIEHAALRQHIEQHGKVLYRRA